VVGEGVGCSVAAGVRIGATFGVGLAAGAAAWVGVGVRLEPGVKIRSNVGAGMITTVSAGCSGITLSGGVAMSGELVGVGRSVAVGKRVAIGIGVDGADSPVESPRQPTRMINALRKHKTVDSRLGGMDWLLYLPRDTRSIKIELQFRNQYTFYHNQV